MARTKKKPPLPLSALTSPDVKDLAQLMPTLSTGSNTIPAPAATAPYPPPTPTTAPKKRPADRVFSKEHRSPFRDGYSIEGEEQVMKAYLDSGIELSKTLQERLEELEERKEQLANMRSVYKSRKGSEWMVEEKEHQALYDLGGLVDEQTDQMLLHTKEAFRMFMGRAKDPSNPTLSQIAGAKRIASALRDLWLMTASDNPYADWALLRHEQMIAELQKRLASEIKQAEAMLDEHKKKGLICSILQSSSPQALNLGFFSPYGYAISNLVVDYDYYIRVQKTMAHKSLRSDEQVREAIAAVTKFARRVFNETARFERWLRIDEIRGLCRLDFVPGASPEAGKRVEFVTGVFGMIPADIYSGKLQPRHSKRRINATPNEKKLLQLVGAELARKELEQTAQVQTQKEETDASN